MELNRLKLSEYLMESVASGKRRNFSPIDYDEVVYWLEENGFERLPDYTHQNAGLFISKRDKRWQRGPWRSEETSKWITVGVGRNMLTIRFGCDNRGKPLKSTYYPDGSSRKEEKVDPSGIKKKLLEMIGEE